MVNGPLLVSSVTRYMAGGGWGGAFAASFPAGASGEHPYSATQNAAASAARARPRPATVVGLAVHISHQ